MIGMSETITPSFEEIQAQLDRILASRGFVNSNQRKDLLRYLVHQTLRGEILTEKDVSRAVFPVYPIPPESRIVSVVATEIRKRLGEYYEAHPDDLVNLQVPRVEALGAYRAGFSYRNDPEAVKVYNQGHLYLAEGSLRSCDLARVLFEDATRLDPMFDLAYAAQAEAEIRCALLHALESQQLPRSPMHNETGQPMSLGSTRWRMESAQTQAEAAIKINPKCFRAHVVLATVYACKFEWEEASLEFEVAKQISRDEVENHPLYAGYLLAIGEVRQALEIVERRIRIAPSDSFNYGLERLFRYLASMPTTSEVSPSMNQMINPLNDSNLHWLSRVVHNLELMQHDPNAIYIRDDFEARKLEFYPFGFVSCGLASLRNPREFLEEPVQVDVIEDIDQYLYDVLAWDFYAPLNLQRAFVLMALAVIKRHQGIPSFWCTATRRRENSWLSNQKPNESCDRLQGLAVSCIHDACSEHDPLMAWLHLWPTLDTLRERSDFKVLIDRMSLPIAMTSIPDLPAE